METLTNRIVEWIQNWFKENGDEHTKAVIGISGGKDSSVVAALCCRALGPERVLGVIMPCGTQSDIAYSYDLVNHLGIESVQVNIGPMYEVSLDMIENSIGSIQNSLVKGNLQARLRMSTLYAISQERGGRVSNNCNKSERFVGYATLYGDNVGDFSPLQDLTVEEVKLVGRELGLPRHLCEKTPIDGLANNNENGVPMTDEESMGFTYKQIEEYMLTGDVKGDKEVSLIIEQKNKYSEFKRKLVQLPHFEK